MKQKIVIRVSMNNINCHKCRRKAMETAVCMPGVESLALTGQEKNQVEVVGDGIDAAELTRRLRKNVAHAELVSVAEVKKEQPAQKKQAGGATTTTTETLPVPVALGPPCHGFPHCHWHEYEVREPICTIL